MAKKKGRRKASPAQLAALRKGRAKLKAKYGTADISKIGGKKRRRKRRTAAEEEALLENAAKKKRKPRRKKAKAKRKPAKRKPAKRKPAKRKPARRPAAAKPRKRRAKRPKHTVAGKVHVVKLPGRTIVKEIRVEAAKKRKKRKKKAGGVSAGRAWPGARQELMLENPMGEGLGGYEALFENPAGPYSTTSLKGFGWAAGGVGLGLVVAELVDRYVATRTPSDSKSGQKGTNPWYGRDAAAAMQRRPDALRLGVQAVGALAGIGGAYALRGRSIAPWLIGGTAVGFGANLFKQLIMWWVAPRVLKAKEDEAVLGNRLLPLEQVELQDKIDAIWEDWQKVNSLLLAQQTAGSPKVVSPLNTSTDQDLLTLGGATGNGPLPGAVGFVAQPGRVGACMSCGGMQGCWSNCPQLCGNKCPEGSGIPQGGNGQRGRLCEYTVQAGDNLSALVDASGVTVNDIAALNGGGTPDTWWQAGATVTLPEQACYVVWRHQGGGGGENGGGGGEPLIPEQPGGGGLIPEQPTRPGGGQVYRSSQPQVPARPGFMVPGPLAGVVSDEVQRQVALRNIGGDESEEE